MDMKPNVRLLDNVLQLCYNLPHRIHTSKAYPVRSPQGSKIIVYGHENGLRLIWRGGKPLRQSPRDFRDSKSNGANEDSMVLDSLDKEMDKKKLNQDHAAFEDEEQEYDPGEPYEPIIQTLDLPLGVEVLHLAFPHLPIDLHKGSFPALLSQRLIVAVTCSDCSTRLITVPLTPPSHAGTSRREFSDAATVLHNDQSIFGEQMVTLSGGNIHQSIPKGVTVTVTATSSDSPEDIEMDDDLNQGRTSSASRHTSRSRSRSRLGQDQAWDLLVASHSADLSGLLHIYRIPLVSGGTSTSSEVHIPWQTQHLASPAVSVEFNSALYPSPKHSQILVAEEKGAVRIFDCLPKPNSFQGSWLVSLYTSFESAPSIIPKRNHILSARWVRGGKAILVLQADGKWGIWDHEGVGPKPANPSNAASKGFNDPLTTFALEGWVGDSLKSKPLTKNSSNKNNGRSKLAPMTPSTRKMKQDALFTGPATQSEGPIRGGLCVTTAPDPSDNRPDDESILLWHGGNIVVIPSLFTHWQTKTRGSGNLFGSGAKGEPKLINNIQLGGESCTEVNLLSTQNYKQPEILVTGERRLLIVAPPLAEPKTPDATNLQRLAPTNEADQQMLDSGELDLNGMDRILSGMSDSHRSRRNSQISSRSRKSSQGLLLQ